MMFRVPKRAAECLKAERILIHPHYKQSYPHFYVDNSVEMLITSGDFTVKRRTGAVENQKNSFFGSLNFLFFKLNKVSRTAPLNSDKVSINQKIFIPTFKQL